MNILTLAVLLAVAFFAPVPRQPTNNRSESTQEPSSKTKHSANPTLSAPGIPPKDCKSEEFKNDPDCKPSADKESTVVIGKLPTANVAIQRNAERDLADWIAYGFGIALTVAGIFGVCLAFGTLRAIERQAVVMGEQRK
jgi:hypothetical protein